MAQEKKKFFDVEIPGLGTKIKLLAYSIEQLDKRIVKLDMTRQLRGKSLEAVIRIKVENGKAEGTLIKIFLLGFFIRRMMRNNISYVEDSFSVDSLDSTLRIKPFMITRKRVTRAVRKALRDETKKFLQEYSKDNDSEGLFNDVLDNRLQKSLSQKLKKIYPLALCEIREIKIEKMSANPVKPIKKHIPKIEEEEEKSQIEEVEAELAKKAEKQEKAEKEKLILKEAVENPIDLTK